MRNFISGNKPYFVILPKTERGVSIGVKFAAQHNLSLAVFGTGHEFQDRNSAIEPNGLLIRTICLRTVNIDIDPNNRFGHADGVSKDKKIIKQMQLLPNF